MLEVFQVSAPRSIEYYLTPINPCLLLYTLATTIKQQTLRNLRILIT